MTKCPAYCKLRTSFTYKLLVSLKRLQNVKKFCNGVNLEEVEKFMEKVYSMTGDVRSQIENSIRKAEESRLVIKKKNGYILLPPAACLHNVPAPCVKAKLEEIEKSFNVTTCEKERKPKKLDCLPNVTRRKRSERLKKSKPKSTLSLNTKYRTTSRSRSRSKSGSRSRSRSPQKKPLKDYCDCEDAGKNPCDVDDDSSDSSCD